MGYSKGFCLLFMLVIIVAHFSPSAAWWGRRRRRRCHVPHKPVGKPWANNWDQQMHFECPVGQSINTIYSIYSSCHRDRVWSFGCHSNPAATVCRWTYNVNYYDQPINFHCDGFLNGIRSHHSNHHEDRQYSFRCCRSLVYKKAGCITTNFWQNSWRGVLDYRVPHGYYLSGATSVHDNGQEDRRWHFEYCKRVPRQRGDDTEKDKDTHDQDTMADDLDPEENTEPQNEEDTFNENVANDEKEITREEDIARDSSE